MMSNKTDWPDWAEYRTVDPNRDTWYHELKPVVNDLFEEWFSAGKMLCAPITRDTCIDWRDSLERRPK